MNEIDQIKEHLEKPSQVDGVIAERLKALFPDNQVASRFVDLVVSKRPVGVSRKCCYPYYKESYALWLKPFVDEMIKTRLSIIYRFETYNDVSPKTLYNKVNQAARYLCDNLDPNDNYKAWRRVVNFTIDKKRGGIVIEFIPEFRSNATTTEFKPELIAPKEVGIPQWQVEMDAWLESNDPRIKPFLKERLALTPAEVASIKTTLEDLIKSGLPIMYSVDCRSLKILRFNKDA